MVTINNSAVGFLYIQ